MAGLQVKPPSVDFESQMSVSVGPLRWSAQLIYIVPLYGPLLLSQHVIGIPLQRSISGMEISQPPGMGSTKMSLYNHVKPPLVDLSNIIPRGPAHETYISPFGPTVGTAPSTVLSLSVQFPPFLLILVGIDQLAPALVEREKRIMELSFELELP